MRTRHAMGFLGVLLASLAIFGGCPQNGQDSSARFLVGQDQDSAYFAYFPEWSGFETLPSSLWRVDLATGQSKQVLDRRVRYDTQIGGRFAVFERPTDAGSEVVAVSLADGESQILTATSTTLGGRYDVRVKAAGARAIVRTAAGLSVFDLDALGARFDISSPQSIVEILSASERWAVVSVSSMQGSKMIFDLSTGDYWELAELDRYSPFLSDAAFDGDRFVTVGFVSESHTRYGLLEYGITAREWTVIDEFESETAYGATSVVALRGDTIVLNSVGLLTPSRIDQMSRTSGVRENIDIKPGSLPYFANQAGANLAWFDAEGGELTIQSLDSGSRRSLSISIPH